jgi:hypothetical protein
MTKNIRPLVFMANYTKPADDHCRMEFLDGIGVDKII